MPQAPSPFITIGIKALNEERHIAAAIESALAALEEAGVAGEVVLADSGSRDATVDIARRYPIRILQLANRADACCGAGAQLAFQGARGDFFCLIDGDMQLHGAFLREGLAFLAAHPAIAGVGGHVREVEVANAEFAIRAAAAAARADMRPGPVDRLDCGGLYRVAALREVGWFADRNLHAFEEMELGARLAARGWGLARIDCPGVDHHGHADTSFGLLWRRLRTGYAGAPGEVLRAALGSDHLRIVLRRLGHIRHAAVVMAWWLGLAALALLGCPWWVMAALVAAPLAFLAWRRGSLRLGAFSFLQWQVTALALPGGLLRHRTDPRRPLAAVDLSPGSV